MDNFCFTLLSTDICSFSSYSLCSSLILCSQASVSSMLLVLLTPEMKLFSLLSWMTSWRLDADKCYLSMLSFVLLSSASFNLWVWLSICRLQVSSSILASAVFNFFSLSYFSSSICQQDIKRACSSMRGQTSFLVYFLFLLLFLMISAIASSLILTISSSSQTQSRSLIQSIFYNGIFQMVTFYIFFSQISLNLDSLRILASRSWFISSNLLFSSFIFSISSRMCSSVGQFWEIEAVLFRPFSLSFILGKVFMYSLWAILRWYPLWRTSVDGIAFIRIRVLLLDSLV